MSTSAERPLEQPGEMGQAISRGSPSEIPDYGTVLNAEKLTG
jgi:hypothetical protein